MPTTSKTDRIIGDFCKSVVDRARGNLGATRTVNGKKRRTVATGALKDSLTFIWRQRGDRIVMEFYSKKGSPASKYAGFVESGRRAGARMPPIQPILDWMKVKPIRLRDLVTGQFVTATESKKKSVAFLIARSIGEKGIPAVRYWEEAIQREMEETGDVLIKHITEDIFARINPEK